MRRRSRFAKLVAGTLVLGLASQVQGSPGDVVTMAAPMLGADPPAATEIRDGDASVATQRGNLQYSYPIQVPPGRLGNQPSLALTYSSDAPIYGGVAAGWSLTIPEIVRDTSEGTLRKFSDDPDAWEHKRFVSTMAGSRPLIAVDEPGNHERFRAQNDTTYTRYERMPQGSPYQWIARTTDGTTYFFGDADHVLPAGFDVDRVPLTRTMDAFGNTVDYRWSRDFLTNELVLGSIEYARNDGAGLPATARVSLFWNKGSSCGFEQPVNAAHSYRNGKLEQQGGKRLEWITVEAFDPFSRDVFHTRVITLGYEEGCGQGSSGGRFLTSIQESAWGDTEPRVDLPAVTFEYGDTERTDWEFATHENWSSGSGGSASNALSFGRRFNPARRWPTVDAMFADLDGDGLVDRMVSTFTGETCGVEWFRNTGTGFDPQGTFSLPHLPWADDTPDPFGCSLNSQFTRVDNLVEGGPCGAKDDGTQLAYRWLDVTGDGLTDLVTAIHHDGNTYDPNRGPVPRFHFDDGSFGEPIVEWPECQDAPACPAVEEGCYLKAIERCVGDEPCGLIRAEMQGCLHDADPVPCKTAMRCDPRNPESCLVDPRPCDSPQIPHERCGLYPWMIYENQGGGRFPITPVIQLNPIPLESFNGDSPSGAGGFSSAEHAVTDLDGDGLLDAVVIPSLEYHPPLPLPLSPKNYWFVWKGDGTGGFTADEDGQPFVWQVPSDARPSFSDNERPFPGEPDDQILKSTAGLADFNADGRQDYYWRELGSDNVHVYWNNGHRFTFESLRLGQSDGVEVADVSRTFLDVDSTFGDDVIIDGFVEQKTRLVDYDDDGRVDLLSSSYDAATGWSDPVMLFNTGSDLGPGYELTTNERLAQSTLSVATGPDLRWQTSVEVLDLDGDGADEMVHVDATGGFLHRFRNVPDGKPARLMTAFHNGQGLHVAVEYAPLTDAIVRSDAASRKASPQTRWVVKSLTTTDDFESTASKSSYEYRYPKWSPDERDDWAFRGFETVRTTNPRGGVVEERYRYDVDYTGRLAATLTLPAEAANQPTSIVDTEWRRYELFDGAIETFHPTITYRWTCANGQDEAACRARLPADNNGMVREEQIWTAIAATTGGTDPTPLLYANTRTSRQLDAVPAEGDRYFETTFGLFADDSEYRLRATSSVSKVRRNVVEEVFARSETVWDDQLLVPLEERVYFDETEFAATERSYDLRTGLVRKVAKPEQALIPGKPHTLYVWDASQVFVAETTNEEGHVVLTEYEPGTGALVSTRGPNSYACGAGCVSFEERRTDVDGLGRTIASHVPLNGVGAYVLRKVSETTYVDTPSGATPTSITTRTLIDYDDTRWTEDVTELDGHGRPIRMTKHGGPAPAVTTYDYAEDGTLAAVTAPDPSEDGAFVTFTYTFDSIGRPTGMRRPDGTGTDLTYNGLSEASQEVVFDGGPAAKTELVHDDFGRLVAVHEYLDDEEVDDEDLDDDDFALTSYAYDPRDTIELVVDPELVTTTMAHDFAGRRTSITRLDRTWKFFYDRNGNVEREVSPVPWGELECDYTTSFAYDDLDRLTSKAVAPRDLSGDDLALFGLGGATAYLYDRTEPGANGIGRLHTVVDAVLSTKYAYDAEGNVIEEGRGFDFAGVTGTRRVQTTYGPAGRVREIDYGDSAASGAGGTLARFGYDDRAQPIAVELRRVGGSWETAATFTRNVAGLVTSRFYDGAPDQTATWTYDELGRVLRTFVKVAGQSGVAADQALTYWHSDDPRTLKHLGKGLTTRAFRFEYDRRHQLKLAETTAPWFSGEYRLTPGGRLDHVTVDADASPGSDVRNRDVRYVYGTVDPEMLLALRRPDGTDFATYTYDLSGNVESQVQEGVSTAFTWDGEDQLRRAATDTGAEEYFYDHTGARTAVLQRNADGELSQLKYFQGPLEVWFGPNSSPTRRLAHVGMGTPVARVETTSGVPTMELQYHSTLQSLMASVSTNGTITSTFAYGPHGEVLQAGGSQLSSHRRRFNDKQKDDLTGLYYYGARYFDSTALVWKSADPAYRFVPDAAWAKPRLAALYTLDLANPLRYVDPDGRGPCQYLSACAGVNEHVAWSASVELWTLKTLKEVNRGIEQGRVRNLDQSVANNSNDVLSLGNEFVEGVLDQIWPDSDAAGASGGPPGPRGPTISNNGPGDPGGGGPAHRAPGRKTGTELRGNYERAKHAVADAMGRKIRAEGKLKEQTHQGTSARGKAKAKRDKDDAIADLEKAQAEADRAEKELQDFELEQFRDLYTW